MTMRFAIRSDTAERWELYNPILACGEPGWDITHMTIKIGDGTTPWCSLPYVTEATP